MTDANQPPSVKEFLESQAGPRLAAQVADLERRLKQIQGELDDLRAAAGTVSWQIEGEAPVYFNFAGGQGTVSDQPAKEPVMTARLSAASWTRLVTGQVAGGFLDSSNRGGFGKARLEKLKPIRGTVRFALTELADGGDWSVDVGINMTPAETPTATISMPAAVAADIQAGKSNPQMAFMQGKVKMQGDAALVMQFGTAMFM